MTLTLILVRHAKSDHPAGTGDHDRPLNERGRKDAPRMGSWLSRRGHAPERVLCSTARRAVETWEGLQEGGLDASATFEGNLYHAAPDTMIDMLKGRQERSLMIVGHNPGMGLLAARMAVDPPDDGAFLRYPTCAVTVLRFDAEDWSGAAPGTGEVVDFAVPRRLAE